jgi:predicted dehydrogenase
VTKPRIAVVGAGSFGRNHLRVIHQSPHGELAGVLDLDDARARQAAETHGCPVFASLEQLAQNADAAVIATPTVTHADIGCRLMELGVDVLVEKPIAHEPAAARRLVDDAARLRRILLVGHLERFNPAIVALESAISQPLFFEIHRMSEFSPRSLDVDVVLDLMIHDLDIVLSLTGSAPEEIRAAGISILSAKVDIANVRLQFPGGCIANFTASRVSTERVRKLRLFQPHEYISLDYSRQDAVRFRVGEGMKIDFAPLPVEKDEPLRLEIEHFIECVSSKSQPTSGPEPKRQPRATGVQGLAALDLAFAILAKIEEHSRLVAGTLGASRSSVR